MTTDEEFAVHEKLVVMTIMRSQLLALLCLGVIVGHDNDNTENTELVKSVVSATEVDTISFLSAGS